MTEWGRASRGKKKFEKWAFDFRKLFAFLSSLHEPGLSERGWVLLSHFTDGDNETVRWNLFPVDTWFDNGWMDTESRVPWGCDFFQGWHFPVWRKGTYGLERASSALPGVYGTKDREPYFLCVPKCPAFAFFEPQGKIYELAVLSKHLRLPTWLQVRASWISEDVPAQPYQQLSQLLAKMLKNPTDIYICVCEICLLGKLALLLKKKKRYQSWNRLLWVIFSSRVPAYSWVRGHCITPSPSRLLNIHVSLAPALSSQGKPLCDGFI